MIPPIRILYRNHRGEVGWRTVTPTRWEYGRCEWHPGEQWLIFGWDHDKQDFRTYAYNDVIEWGAAQSLRPDRPKEETTDATGIFGDAPRHDEGAKGGVC